jgi:uncharacterized lipoprotein YbaY
MLPRRLKVLGQRVLPVLLISAALLAAGPLQAQAGQPPPAPSDGATSPLITLVGTASLEGSAPLPADAVLEVQIIDTALADAPAPVLARWRRAPAGPGRGPFRFALGFQEPSRPNRYGIAVRAEVRQAGRLLYLTDTRIPLPAGARPQLRLQLVRVAGDPQADNPARASLGALPGSWEGAVGTQAGAERWHLDLAPEGSFALRRWSASGPDTSARDAIGRWRVGGGVPQLLLEDGERPPLQFQVSAGGTGLNLAGATAAAGLAPGSGRLLKRLEPEPIDPTLELSGMVSLMADAPSIVLCATGQRLPVAMEGANLALERAYLAQRHAPGAPWRVRLAGLITERPSAEPFQAPRRTLVVQRLLGAEPGGASGCDPGRAQAAFSSSSWAKRL